MSEPEQKPEDERALAAQEADEFLKDTSLAKAFRWATALCRERGRIVRGNVIMLIALLGVVATAAYLCGGIIPGRENDDLKEKISDNDKDAQKEIGRLRDERAAFEKRATDAERDKQLAVLRKDDLETKIAPILNLAMEKFPGVELNESVKRIVEKVESTDEKMTALTGKFAPRVITKEQRETLLKHLHPETADPIRITYGTADREVKDYAEAIESILKEAGYKLDIERSIQLLTKPPVIGVRVVFRDRPQAKNFQAFRAAFEAANIRCEYAPASPTAPPELIAVTVGPKP